MQKSDIVLIKFPFLDLSGTKLRPAVVLVNSDTYISVAFITSQIKWQVNTDILLLPTMLNGLKKESLLRLNKIATLEKTLVKGKLGLLSDTEVYQLNTNLKILFQLD